MRQVPTGFVQPNSSAHIRVPEARRTPSGHLNPWLKIDTHFLKRAVESRPAWYQHSISMVTQHDSNNDFKAPVTILLFGPNHSGMGAMPPSPCYAHQYTLTIDFIQLQGFSGQFTQCQTDLSKYVPGHGERERNLPPGTKNTLPCEIWVFAWLDLNFISETVERFNDYSPFEEGKRQCGGRQGPYFIVLLDGHTSD